jgi:hypothetical protein
MKTSEAFQSELAGDESLLWSGQPERNVIFHNLSTIPFSLMSGGLMSALGVGALYSENLPAWSAVFGIPFVILGQYVIWGWFIHVAWKKSRTFYAVTSKRILLRTVGRRSKSNSKMLELSAVGEIKTSICSNSIGTLQFGRAVLRRYGGSSLDLLERNGVPAFVDIADAEAVYRIIMAAIIMAAKEKQDSGQTAVAAYGF